MNSKKSILFVGNHLSLSGQNRSVGEELGSCLEKIGYHTILVSRKQNKFARLWDMLWTIFRQRWSFEIGEVDVFSGQAFLWAFLSAGMLKLEHKPLILTLHGGNLPDYAASHPRRIRKLLSWADSVVAPSYYLKQEFAEYRPDIHIVPNGLEVNEYPFRLRTCPAPELIWLRSFHQIYNPSLAIKVVKILKDQKIDANLKMIGPDKKDGSLQDVLQMSKDLDLLDTVNFIRGVSKKQVPELLAQGNIFLNTTNVDNTPVSVIEAMACGLCIVTTNVGGIPYLLEHGVDALLVPPDDPDAMAAAVKRILTEAGLAEKLSMNARAKANAFDWSAVLPQWITLFNEIIAHDRL